MCGECPGCFAYKWDGEDYCLIVGEEIQGWERYRKISECIDLKVYNEWREMQGNTEKSE